ncbi:MAG: amino acid ABC transporter substrate-binding protein [Thermoleophilaceae bacterium]
MKIKAFSVAAVAALSLTVAACGSSSKSSSGSGGSSNGGDTIKVGASVPLSGPLAGFGSFVKWGYQNAVKEVNAAGGIQVDGKKKKVQLILLDDKTDPNTVSNNTTRLITRDKVDAMLGSCTPALVNAGALVADRNRVPLVTGCDPLGAFKSVKKWSYAWDLFFDEGELAALPLVTMKQLGLLDKTNKKLAILHDNGPDGLIVGGKILPAAAKQFGVTVANKQVFPTDATQFGSLVQKAKASGADIVFVDAVTPQAVSMRKQMAAAGFKPKVLIMEKGGEPVQFAQALGKLSDGILVGGYWDPSLPYPGAKDLAAKFEKETGNTSSQHIADSMTAAQVLFDAIKAAGTTDKAKVNAAIAKTNKTYVAGPIKFDAAHTAKLNLVEDQWQGGKAVVVGPSKDVQTGDFVYPLP